MLKLYLSFLQIIKVCLVVGLDATFVLLLRKLTLSKTKEALNCSRNLVVYLTECKSYSKQYVGSTITMFCIRFNSCKSAARRVLKTHPNKWLSVSIYELSGWGFDSSCSHLINVMLIKNNFIFMLSLRDLIGWKTGRLLSLIGLKMF